MIFFDFIGIEVEVIIFKDIEECLIGEWLKVFGFFMIILDCIIVMFFGVDIVVIGKVLDVDFVLDIRKGFVCLKFFDKYLIRDSVCGGIDSFFVILREVLLSSFVMVDWRWLLG